MVLRSIGVLSCGKLLGSIYALLGLILGILIAGVSALGIAINPQGNVPADAVPLIFGTGAIILLPIGYGIGGFIGGIIAAAFYNVIAGLVGGLELEFESSRIPPAPDYPDATRQPL